jgi:hypothetical protein
MPMAAVPNFGHNAMPGVKAYRTASLILQLKPIAHTRVLEIGFIQFSIVTINHSS